jgi:predicted HicB family RNase H-like nuclease
MAEYKHSIDGGVSVAKTIIIKNFPEDLHRKAKAKAALEGITLKKLIIKLLKSYIEENAR